MLPMQKRSPNGCSQTPPASAHKLGPNVPSHRRMCQNTIERGGVHEEAAAEEHMVKPVMNQPSAILDLRKIYRTLHLRIWKHFLEEGAQLVCQGK